MTNGLKKTTSQTTAVLYTAKAINGVNAWFYHLPIIFTVCRWFDIWYSFYLFKQAKLCVISRTVGDQMFLEMQDFDFAQI